MRLALNFKSGVKEVLSEEETSKVISSLNYLKIIKYLMNTKNIEVSKIKILDREILTEDLRSMEILF